MAVIEGPYDLLLLANLNYAAACTNSSLVAAGDARTAALQIPQSKRLSWWLMWQRQVILQVCICTDSKLVA